MDPLLSSYLFVFSVLSFSTQSNPLPPLLSVRCYPSPSNHCYNACHDDGNPILALLDNLTMEAPNSLLTISDTSFGQERYTGLLQCRPGLGSKKCTICANTARRTIPGSCQNSNAVSAWFDGCYVQIVATNSSDRVEHIKISNHSCSSRASNQDPARFAAALEALLLKLRADASIATPHGFSQGDVSYESSNHSDSKIYGLVECVRSLSARDCNSCIGKATEKLQVYSGGKNGGLVVNGPCLVRFDSNEFYHEDANSANEGMTGNFTVWEGGNGGCRRKGVMAYWGGGVGCLVAFVLLAWLLRRAVLNRAKVGSLEFDETK